MAVTQQIARLTDALVDKCALDSTALDSVCAGVALAADDYADLDWAPNLLEKAASRAGIDSAVVEALKRSTDGDAEVHPGYAGIYSAYATPTYLSASAVKSVSAMLDSIDSSTLLAPDVVEDVVAGMAIVRPFEYLVDYFDRLRDFYRESMHRGLAVLLWWD